MISTLKKHDFLFITLLGIACFFLIRLYIPFIDDLKYANFHQGDDIIWNRPISSLADAIQSQQSDYFYKNGRVVTHTIVQYLCGMPWGKYVFFITSAFMLMMLFKGMLTLVREKCSTVNPLDKYVLLGIFLLGCAAPGITLIGNIACTVNYLWTATFIVWTINCFKVLESPRELSSFKKALMVCFAFYTSTLHEGFSIPLSAYFFFYLCLNRKSINRWSVITILTFFAGTALTVFSPSNFLRAGLNEAASENVSLIFLVLQKFLLIARRFLLIVEENPRLDIMVLILGLLSWRKSSRALIKNIAVR